MKSMRHSVVIAKPRDECVRACEGGPSLRIPWEWVLEPGLSVDESWSNIKGKSEIQSALPAF
jgi:hypothetical protein